MTESFSNWLKENFLAGPERKAPSADGPPPPHCSGNKANCFKYLLELLDGQLTPEQEVRMEANILNCGPCYHELDLQLAIKEALKLKIETQKVPMSLLEQIKEKITQLA